MQSKHRSAPSPTMSANGTSPAVSTIASGVDVSTASPVCGESTGGNVSAAVSSTRTPVSGSGTGSISVFELHPNAINETNNATDFMHESVGECSAAQNGID